MPATSPLLQDFLAVGKKRVVWFHLENSPRSKRKMLKHTLQKKPQSLWMDRHFFGEVDGIKNPRTPLHWLCAHDVLETGTGECLGGPEKTGDLRVMRMWLMFGWFFQQTPKKSPEKLPPKGNELVFHNSNHPSSENILYCISFREGKTLGFQVFMIPVIPGWPARPSRPSSGVSALARQITQEWPQALLIPDILGWGWKTGGERGFGVMNL